MCAVLAKSTGGRVGESDKRHACVREPARDLAGIAAAHPEFAEIIGEINDALRRHAEALLLQKGSDAGPSAQLRGAAGGNTTRGVTIT